MTAVPVALGLDVGTTSVKALALGAGGNVLATASAHHGISDRAGVVAVDPRRWWDSTRSALAALARGLAEGLAGMRVIGLAGNMSSVVLLDRAGEPMIDAPLLADGRGAAQIAALDAATATRLAARSHNHPGVVFSLATLLWLRDEAPDLLDAAGAWISAKDYLRLRLTATVGTEPTDAYNSLLVDPATGAWDHQLIADLGLPGAPFPTMLDSAQIAGTLTAEAAADTGLPAGVPVIAGVSDMAATVLGIAEPAPGHLMVSLGTSVTAIECIASTGFQPEWSGRLTYHPLPAGHGAFALASLLTGGLAINWVRSRFGAEHLDGDDRPLDPADPLVFLPHLAGTGTPDFHANVRGGLLGLSPATTGTDIARALYEAIGCELTGVVDLLGPDRIHRITLTGGGIRLPPLVHAIADLLDRDVHAFDVPDASALGAARLAWQATGEPCPPAAPGRPVAPRPKHRAAWTARRARYQRARGITLPYYLGAPSP